MHIVEIIELLIFMKIEAIKKSGNFFTQVGNFRFIVMKNESKRNKTFERGWASLANLELRADGTLYINVWQLWVGRFKEAVEKSLNVHKKQNKYEFS